MSEKLIGTVSVTQASNAPTTITLMPKALEPLMAGEPNPPLDARVTIGGSGTDGVVCVFRNDRKHDPNPSMPNPADISGPLTGDNTPRDPSITLNAVNATVQIGAAGHAGSLSIVGGSPAKPRIQLDGDIGRAALGGNGANGQLQLFNKGGLARIRLVAETGAAYLGGHGNDGDLFVFPSNSNNSTQTEATIHLDGAAGDIKLRNADCAEEFDILDHADVEPGSVMVIDDDDRLRMCCDPYDRRVAGVISGAGIYRPGLVLDRKPHAGRKAVALIGKVYCKVDARLGAIEIGDLLTTSPTMGHAMKATDPTRAFGAVIGKALRPLASGVDLIPILIALQ